MDDRERELMEFYRELIRRLMIRCCQLYYMRRLEQKVTGNDCKYFRFEIRNESEPNMGEGPDGMQGNGCGTALPRPQEKRRTGKDMDGYLRAYA